VLELGNVLCFERRLKGNRKRSIFQVGWWFTNTQTTATSTATTETTT
jgi:hypothetical protein